ncbi:YlzJ-like family protein [Desulfuribacillus stibiiarsenatis]|uniref:YlzJ-like family protein n=1 Tax=Desulfuribacillus stibiiarsenatis TaxID=1390249 RepID=UPI0009F50934|nr:YlzJ-like family protein [Desulfuribacillus stibiiarsenatis]
MIIYTPLPIESVLQSSEEVQPTYIEIEYEGRLVQLETIDNYQAKIVRLVSSNPNDYLNNTYMPGKIIYFRPN